MSTTRQSPPKPWEVRRQQSGSTSSLPLPTSTPTLNTAATTPLSTSTALSTTLPASSLNVPPRPGGLGSTYGGGYNSYSSSSYSSPYNRYGSGYGGYGSSSYGGYGSSYGGYGSSYGSGYGGYGSSYGSGYGGYGSSYGGYGGYSRYGSGYGSSYGGYGGGYGPMGARGMFDGPMQGFGMVAEGFSRFSRLLDANFDAMHGSFASILRLFEVFGEFLYLAKTFAVVKFFSTTLRKIGRLFTWLLFGYTTTKLVTGEAGKHGAIEINDFLNHQQTEQGRRKIGPAMLIILGILVVGLPTFISRVVKLFRHPELLAGPESEEKANLDNAWGNGPPLMQAVADFAGRDEMELSFRQGDTILLLGKPYPEWWEGEMNGRKGLFPANYVKPVGPPEEQKGLPPNLPNFPPNNSDPQTN